MFGILGPADAELLRGRFRALRGNHCLVQIEAFETKDRVIAMIAEAGYDLVATGTISGPDEGSEGCLLEMKHRAGALRLSSDETRVFLEDGDQVTFRAYAEREGLSRIGFGECTGTVLPAV